MADDKQPVLARFTAKMEEAAQLVAAGRLSFEDIATQLKIGERTLYTWRQRPQVRARVDAINAAFALTMQQYAIAQRARRVAALDDRHRRLENLLLARAEAYAGQTGGKVEQLIVAGGDTGLLVEQIKATGEGSYQVEYVFDAAVVRELRAHEEQAAKELGQWVEKVAPVSPDGATAFKGMADDDILRLAAATLTATTGGDAAGGVDGG